MSRDVTVFLNSVCEPIHSIKVQLLVRAELTGHITNVVEELVEKGMDVASAETEALRRMGDPNVIGKEIADLNSPILNLLTLIAGIIMFIAAFVFLEVTTVPIKFLIDERALLFILLITFALVLIGGLNRFTRRTAFERARKSALYSGVIGIIIGGIDCLANIGSADDFGVSLAFCLTSFLYAVISMALVGSLDYLTRPLETSEIRKIIGNEDNTL